MFFSGGKENAESQSKRSNAPLALPGISVVRVGQTRKIHPDVLSVSLDELVKKKLAKGQKLRTGKWLKFHCHSFKEITYHIVSVIKIYYTN